MTKRGDHGIRDSLAQKRAAGRSLPALVALCLVLLQFGSVLHFALIPHGFGAAQGGFVHLHGARAAQASAATKAAPGRATLVAGARSCAPEACPVGFSGPSSVLLARGELHALLSLPALSAPLSTSSPALTRSRVLLNAPKTSPPLRG